MSEILVQIYPKSLKMDLGLFKICTNNKKSDLGLDFSESDLGLGGQIWVWCGALLKSQPERLQPSKEIHLYYQASQEEPKGNLQHLYLQGAQASPVSPTRPCPS